MKNWPARLALLAVILAAEFAVLEAGLRWRSGTEASPTFQQIFMPDAQVGHRLRPGAMTRYHTVEFTTDLVINPQGVRDDAPIGPKDANERRVVILGDSLVLSVQVGFQETFAKQLERSLQAGDSSHRWRVINGGVQGYGPVDEWLFYHHVAKAFDADLVLVVVFVGNDATEAYDKRASLDTGVAVLPDGGPNVAGTRLRRIARSSMVLQNARMRWTQLKSRFEGPGAERPLTSYLVDPPADVLKGLEVSRRAFERISTEAATRNSRTALVLMPARFQTDDGDYERLQAIVAAGGDTLLRDAATERFREAMAPLGLPILDLLPILQQEPDRIELFFQRNVHLTPRGHRVVAKALTPFVLGVLGSTH